MTRVFALQRQQTKLCAVTLIALGIISVFCNSQATALNPIQGRNVGTTREKRSVLNDHFCKTLEAGVYAMVS